MKKIIEDNYQSIVDRGFIDPLTTRSDFFDKIDEEVLIMVCLNFAKHYDFDIEQQIKDKIEINKQRAKDGR
jgi:hypothetical protein